ncbi:acyltransferase family protein [Paenibacillus sp. NPDC058367]|uniref:acyltransferase family protein n=1 Tax=Paenibacillus sp. NPDC058367 TaxID=3346460 RepID=UPI00365FA26C
MSTKDRKPWLDIAKGIGITSVVVGHSGHPIAQYLFWFHMPLFFIISGFLFKPLNDWKEIKIWSEKKAQQLLIPYLSFGVIISVFLFFEDLSIVKFFKNIIKLGYGGEELSGAYGVFWFVTCLFLTKIFFAFMQLAIKNKIAQLSLIILSYFLAHLIAWSPVLSNFKTPWNFDVVTLSIVFYAIGFFGKEYLQNTITKTGALFLSFTSALIIMILEKLKIINYQLDMKANLYNSVVLDFLIPIIFSVFILLFSYKISTLHKHNVFKYFGVASLTIMYCHIPINMAIHKFIGNYNAIIYILLGIFLPVAIHFILQKFKPTRILFLGISKDNQVASDNKMILATAQTDQERV